ncbi:MAG: hypothetical protein QG572_1414, partial [Pseudomonadota bacterium]|nr:hypothetical protein [Pseudomonadota bacterium]
PRPWQRIRPIATKAQPKWQPTCASWRIRRQRHCPPGRPAAVLSRRNRTNRRYRHRQTRRHHDHPGSCATVLRWPCSAYLLARHSFCSVLRHRRSRQKSPPKTAPRPRVPAPPPQRKNRSHPHRQTASLPNKRQVAMPHRQPKPYLRGTGRKHCRRTFGPVTSFPSSRRSSASKRPAGSTARGIGEPSTTVHRAPARRSRHPDPRRTNAWFISHLAIEFAPCADLKFSLRAHYKYG